MSLSRLYEPYWIIGNILPAMVSAFGQPEFTVTIIAMWCHMVWNPASHLTEGKRKNPRSLSTEWKSNTATRKASQKKMTRPRQLLLPYRETHLGKNRSVISEKYENSLACKRPCHIFAWTYLSLFLINRFPACFWKAVFTVIRTKIFCITAIWLLQTRLKEKQRHHHHHLHHR